MKLNISFRNLLRNPRRTITIVATVSMGAAALFLYHGFNAGIMNQYRENTIRSRYGNGQINTAGYRNKVYEKPWEHWITNFDEVKEKLKSEPSIKHIFPRINFFGLITNGNITVGGRGQGIDAQEESKFFTMLSVEEGENISTEEAGIIIGKGLARSLDVKIGDRLTILANTIHGSLNGIDVNVVGIFHTGAKEFDDSVFRLPIKQVQLLLDTQKVEVISVGLDQVASWPKVNKLIENNFPNLDTSPFEVLDKIYYQNSIDFLQSQFDFIKLIIIAIVLLGIFNSISTSILERKKEIGNLRANGESKKDVLILLVYEGLYLGFFGSLLGIIIATVLCMTVLKGGISMPPAPGITKSFSIVIELQANYAINIMAIGLITGLIATLLAGIKTINMEISTLLRSN